LIGFFHLFIIEGLLSNYGLSLLSKIKSIISQNLWNAKTSIKDLQFHFGVLPKFGKSIRILE